jgi:hypothetical protein
MTKHISELFNFSFPTSCMHESLGYGIYIYICNTKSIYLTEFLTNVKLAFYYFYFTQRSAFEHQSFFS